jgi:hypothetical protein
MPTKPLYVICIFNLYSDEPDEPGESPGDRERRKQTYHYAGFTPEEVEAVVRGRFARSCDHNWYPPLFLGEFPTKVIEDGWEVVDVESLTCPHCGQTF